MKFCVREKSLCDHVWIKYKAKAEERKNGQTFEKDEVRPK